jgi:hypothetical protein
MPQKQGFSLLDILSGLWQFAAMWKRRRILFSVVVIAGLTGLGFIVLRKRPALPPEPVYNGRPISFWIDRPSVNFVPGGGSPYGMVQFPKTVDDKALPYLIQALHRKNSPMLKVSQAVWRSSPVWLKNRWAQPLDVAPVRSAAALVIGNLGAAGRPAIPDLIHVLQEDSVPEVRACAAFALGQIGYGDTAVSNALALAATETNKMVGGTAASSLARIGWRSGAAVRVR